MANDLFSVGDREGKYYGTDILYGKQVIGAVWHHKLEDVPSDRELVYWGGSADEFMQECCDSHWESEANYKEAIEIVATLNKLHQHP